MNSTLASDASASDNRAAYSEKCGTNMATLFTLSGCATYDRSQAFTKPPREEEQGHDASIGSRIEASRKTGGHDVSRPQAVADRPRRERQRKSDHRWR